MADTVIVCAGTKRGLFLFESNRGRKGWKLRGPFLKGWQVYHAIVDTRGTPRIHAAATNQAFACTTFNGDLAGRKFQGAKRPPRPPKLLPKQLKQCREWHIPTEERVWHIEPGPVGDKKVLYAGTAPAALFRSDDGGSSWNEVTSLTRHPSRKDWGPGAGGMALHSIQIDPQDPKRIYVAISAAGAFRSNDGGRSWSPINKAVARYVGAPKKGMTGT